MLLVSRLRSIFFLGLASCLGGVGFLAAFFSACNFALCFASNFSTALLLTLGLTSVLLPFVFVVVFVGFSAGALIGFTGDFALDLPLVSSFAFIIFPRCWK